jgi:uncharacterized coiled-coil DUF342 family protein
MRIAYYEELIVKSYEKIEKYRRQIDGLQKFSIEVERGMNKSSKTICQRRNKINQITSVFYKHPLMNMLTTYLAQAIDVSYENSVSN